MVHDDLVYPGQPLRESVTPAGVRHGSTAAFAEGIVTRGVLVDLAVDGPLPSAHPVAPEDFEQAEERLGVRVEAGDALVVRCGWTMTSRPENPLPGISLDAVRWMHRRGVSVYAGDIGDAVPPLDPASSPAPPRIHGMTGIAVNPLAIF